VQHKLRYIIFVGFRHSNVFAPAFEKSYLCMHLVAPGASPPQHQAPLECRFETIMTLITRLGVPWHLLLSDSFERRFEWSPAKAGIKGNTFPKPSWSALIWTMTPPLVPSLRCSWPALELGIHQRTEVMHSVQLSCNTAGIWCSCSHQSESWKFCLNDWNSSHFSIILYQ
jgi:hypothetical protein